MSWGAADFISLYDVPLTFAVLHPHAAYDYECMANRLLDPELLAGAVAVRVFRAPLLAVPVGRRRRGGTLSVASETVGAAITVALSTLPGFPDVRLGLAPELHSSHVVEWGEPLPEGLSDDARLLFYGLRGRATASPTSAPSFEEHRLVRSAS